MKNCLALLFLAFGVCLSALEIRISGRASKSERTAAKELSEYVLAITGTKPAVKSEKAPGLPKDGVIFLGDTDAAKALHGNSVVLPPESWFLKSRANDLIISGSLPRGIHYAVYHYLEDFCGCRFWTPFEEYVPKKHTVPLRNISRQGTLTFLYPGYYSIACKDNGKFAVKRRIASFQPKTAHQRNPDKPDEDFGLREEIGPPDLAHTFKKYIPSSKYYQLHPEWFALVNGKRDSAPDAQLCLSNPELRKELTRNVLKNIADSRKGTAEFPALYDLSQNDNLRFCRCPDCTRTARKYGAQSGLLLEAVNETARAAAALYPDVMLNTFAYYYTEKPPQGIRPEKNVCITLCDTLSNYAFPHGTPGNTRFYQTLTDWGKIAGTLRIWDYHTTYGFNQYGAVILPVVNEDIFNETFKLLKRNHARRLFNEFGVHFMDDAHDFRVWMFSKTSENPDSDPDALLEEFARGFYGPVAEKFIAYRKLLRESQNRKKPYITMITAPGAFTHLDLQTVVKAQKLFDEGEKLLSGDKVRLRRWHQARFALDRAVLQCGYVLRAEYFRKHGTLRGYPFDDAQLKKRCQANFQEQYDLNKNLLNRFFLNQEKQLFQREQERFDTYIYQEKDFLPPQRFAGLKPNQYVDLSAFCFNSQYRGMQLVRDPESPTAWAMRDKLPANRNSAKYKAMRNGFSAGIYSYTTGDRPTKFLTKQITGPSYQWYKIARSKVAADEYLYLFDWLLQINLSEAACRFPPDTVFDIYASMKFTGEAFPFGKKGEPDAVWCDRLVLVPVSLKAGD